MMCNGRFRVPRRIVFALIGLPLVIAAVVGSLPTNACAYKPVDCKEVLAEVHGRHLSVFEAAMIGKDLQVPTSSVYRCVSREKEKESR